jgi:hypothetical protein
VCLLVCAGLAQAQTVTVDSLIAKVVSEPNPQPYTLTADFSASLVMTLSTGKVPVHAVGTLFETRTVSGQPRTRKATVTRVDLPVLLRPFSNSVRTILAGLIEAEQKPAELVPTLDIFIQEERNDGRYLLGGVRQDIVTEIMTKYNQQALLKDPTARRAFARWLFSPSQRPTIVRSGPAYAMATTVDDAGLVHHLTLFFDWGQVSSRLTFVMVGGRPFWREVTSEGTSEIPGLGRVFGTMVLQVTNHCLNCQPR